VGKLGKFNNDGFLSGTFASTEPNGLIRFGQNVFMTDGSRVIADRVKSSVGTSLFDVYANEIKLSDGDVVRGTQVSPIAALPVLDPTCEERYLEDVTGPCGAPPVTVPAGTTLNSLAPGVYGALVIDDGGSLLMPTFGTYTFCSIRMDKYATFRPSQQITVNVTGNVSLGAGSIMTTNSGLPFVLNVGGSLFKISQGAYVNASIRCPYGKIKLQRDGTITGCACAANIKTDKHVTMSCNDGS
jgi:hypothetical protein